MDTELPRLNRRCRRLYHRRRAARRHQDAYPKRELRDARARHGGVPRTAAQRGRRWLVQGFDAEDLGGGPEARIQLYYCAELDSVVRAVRVESG